MTGVLPPGTELQMVDTACSSSLYAVDIGAKGLLMGKQDIAVCGGAFALAPRGTVLFSKLQGLSKRGVVHALDQDADGVIFADGAALVVLKRLQRAREDGDRVLGVLGSFGSSSDGKGKAIYAPSSAGQDLAVQRALSGGVSGDEVDWINAHATGTPAGDLAEFTTLREHFGRARPAVVTSNKSLIGHTGWAAGVVSVIEILLGLDEQTIPGQYRFSAPPHDFPMTGTKLEIASTPRVWPAEDDRRRAAAVSGFGFGGTNAHLVVAEHKPAALPPPSRPPAPASNARVAIVGWSAHVPELSSHDDVAEWLAGRRRPAESFGETYPPPPFDRVRLPPRTVRTIDRCQLMILECAHDLRGQLTDFWHDNAKSTGVFVGHMGPTRAAMLFAHRCYLDDIEQALRASPAIAHAAALPGVMDRLRERVRSLIPPSNEDSFPGMMPNVISARVANYFDLNGPNMTMDSGFASALSSIDTACRYLRTGELDFALAGGINGNSLAECRSLVSELAPDLPGLAEGAFLFALTTEAAARRAGLQVLGYVDEPDPEAVAAPDAGRDAGRDANIECGAAAPGHARYLGAAGGLAVLEALHRPAGPVTVSSQSDDDVAAVTQLRLTSTGSLAPAPPAPAPTQPAPATVPAQFVSPQFVSTDESSPGRPLTVRRHVPALSSITPRFVGAQTPFLGDGAVVLTDSPALLATVVDPAANVLVISTAPVDPAASGWRHLSAITPAAVRECLAGLGRPVTHLRVVTDLTRSAPAEPALAEGGQSLLALHDAAYLVLQAAYDELRSDGSSFVTLLLGALPAGLPHPFTGLFSGLVKCAHLELEPCLTFGLCTSTAELAPAIGLAERESAAHRTYPIVFDADGTRKSYTLREAPIALDASAPAALERDCVVLAAGGARGITAEVLTAVAEHFGPKIYLLGSNDLDQYPPDTFAGSDEEFVASKPAYIKAQLAVGDGRTVADINRAFERMADARAAKRNIDQMSARSGAGRVSYIVCDVRDPASVDRAVGQVLAAEGRIDLLVNAAGRNRSSLIKDKDFAEFTAIRDLKVAGYRNLKRALRGNPPRLWCNFGSLLGYFGQLGEADYAAGNDFLASAATYASAALGESERTIGWTLWEGVGMGAGELTNAYYKRAGSYSHMPIAEGVHHFVQELHAPAPAPSVVHLGNAEQATVDRFYPGYLASAAEPDAATPGEQGFYLRRRVASGDRSATFECAFNLDTDGYLAHHTVEGTPTLPGTFVTEIAAEAASHLVPGRQVIGFEDVRFLRFLRVHPEVPAQPKRIRAEVAETAGDITRVQVRITEDVVSPSGVRLVEDRPHFTATVLLCPDFPAAPQWAPWTAADEIEVPDPYHQPAVGVRLTGPFVSTTQTRLHPHGKRARYAPAPELAEPLWSRFAVPPILLDGLARTGVLDLVDGRLLPVAAPLSIRRVDLYQQTNDHALAKRGEPIELYATPAGFDMATEPIRNRLVAASPAGRILAQLKDIKATVVGYIDTRTGQARPAAPDSGGATARG
jgi:3-oxoacyl-(acyl-carrier-protein) synthase/NAD(P)-dependent dehydrogenase (short-subunit alcohol dehydrogenase family)